MKDGIKSSKTNFFSKYSHSFLVLKYSSCGTLLYSADTCGKLAVWRVHSDGKRQPTAELLRSRSEQIALFSAAELGTRSNTRLSGVLSCCVSDTRIAYIGPSQRTLIIADGPTLQTLVQIDLDQLARQCFPHRPDPLFGTLGLVNHMRPPMLDFSARRTQFDYPNLILAAPGGCVFRLHGADGRLLAYATSDTSEITERHGRLESDFVRYFTQPQSDCIVARHNIRTAHYLVRQTEFDTKLSRDICIRSHPSYFTRDQKFCLTVDKSSGLMGGSGIFVWYFSEPYRSIQITSKFSIGATNPLALEHGSGNGASTVPFSSADHKPNGDCPIWDIKRSKFHEIIALNWCFLSPGAIPKTPPPSATVDAFATRNDYVNDESLTNDLSSGAVCTDENDVRTTPQSYRHPKWSINRLSVRNIRFSEAIDREESLLIFSKFHGCGGTTVRGVMGYCTDGLTVDSMVWDAESGLFVFTAGTFLICENLGTGFQQVFASEAPHQIRPSGLGKVPNLCSELLTTLALSCDRRRLAVGTLTTWEVDDQSDHF
ncbi:hypothetical protein FGIG_11706 [Fasciola gigantica]|uniref:Uncharacterized protein n=1 Tax=Fasciola gigantica TaxID=46835 RepID=A0A504YYB7_FASGI|nr:hypothetical protein FGIG_11706 [Fasciola gigantica]